MGYKDIPNVIDRSAVDFIDIRPRIAPYSTEAQNHHLTLIQDHSHQLHLKQLFQIRQSFLIMIIIWEELTDYISIKMVHLN